jgi:tetratricopeptide (TPR) repeat protein
MHYKGTNKLLPDIARELKVQGVVEGDIQREGNQIRINAQLIDVRTDRPIWAQTFVRDSTSILDLQGEVARTIAQEIDTAVTPQEETRLLRNRPVDPAAHDLYLRGVLRLNIDDSKGASDYFRQAIAIDPKSAAAHTRLAECLWRLGAGGHIAYKEAFASQKSEALKAIDIDPSLADAHAELAYAVLALDYDWQGADREFHRALELNPNSARNHERYAIYLLYMGRTDEAIHEAGAGVELDPVSAVPFHAKEMIYFFSRKYDKALSLIDTVRSLDIHPPDWTFFRGAVFSAKGQFAESIEQFRQCPQSAHILGRLGYSYARAGQTTAAQKTIVQLQQIFHREGLGANEIAQVYAGLGDKHNALAWLMQAYSVDDIGLLYMKIDPTFDSLRAEPEFQELERKVGLK